MSGFLFEKPELIKRLPRISYFIYYDNHFGGVFLDQ